MASVRGDKECIVRNAWRNIKTAFLSVLIADPLVSGLRPHWSPETPQIGYRLRNQDSFRTNFWQKIARAESIML